MKTNYIDEILKEFDKEFPILGTRNGRPIEDEIKNFIKLKIHQERERITKLIKTVGATGTEEEVDKLIKLIND